MKYVKTLGLAAIVAAALMAWVGAGSASATEITCGSGSTHSKCAVGQVIHASSIGKAVFDLPFGNAECESTIAGPVSNAGSSTSTASGIITTLDWTNCGGDTVTTLAPGTFEIHTDPPNGSNTGNGILTSTGARITIIHIGVHCVYETHNTELGTVTGSTGTKGHAVLDISAQIPPVPPSGFLCEPAVPFTGKYTVTSPKTLVVH